MRQTHAPTSDLFSYYQIFPQGLGSHIATHLETLPLGIRSLRRAWQPYWKSLGNTFGRN